MTAIPAHLGEVTPRWITEVLRSGGSLADDAAVVSLHPQRIGEGVGIMGELHLTSLTFEGDPDGAPDSVVVKMPSPFEENRQQGINLGMYEAEVRFYRELAPRTPTGLPRVHMSEIVPGTADFVIVMEDLSHLTFVDQATGMSPDQAQAAVEAIADVHAAWWGKVMVDELDWIPLSAGPRIEPHELSGPGGWLVRLPALDRARVVAESQRLIDRGEDHEITYRVTAADGEKLTILVEKDFVCLTGRDDEDESDMYPHPSAGEKSC